MRAYKFLNLKHGLRSLREKRLKISTLSDLNDPFELSPYELTDETLRRVVHNFRVALSNTRGLLCFSKDWRDPVIWAHYADSHKGLCLGFEIPDEMCHRVTYEPERLPFPAQPTLEDAKVLLSTKYVNWQYEQEIRVWAELNDKEGQFYFAPFGASLRLVAVIAGASCTIAESKLIEVLEPSAKDITLIKARAGFKRFEVVEDARGFPSVRRTMNGGKR